MIAGSDPPAKLVTDCEVFATPESRSNGATFSMDDPAVRLRLLVEDEELLVRITPVTPSIAAPSVLSPPIVVRLLLDDDGSVRAQIREAPPALPPPLDPETERRLDAFSAKRWDAVRRPAPPPRVKTEAERRLDSFNDEHWDAWRARTTAKPRPPLSTHGGNEVWRRDAHAPPREELPEHRASPPEAQRTRDGVALEVVIVGFARQNNNFSVGRGRLAQIGEDGEGHFEAPRHIRRVERVPRVAPGHRTFAARP